MAEILLLLTVLNPLTFAYQPFFLLFFFFFFGLFRAVPAAYGGSQAGGQIGVVAAGYTTAAEMPDLHHSS